MGKLGVVKAMGSDGTRTSATMDNAVGGCKYIFIDFVQHMILNMHPFNGHCCRCTRNCNDPNLGAGC